MFYTYIFFFPTAGWIENHGNYQVNWFAFYGNLSPDMNQSRPTYTSM